MSEKSSSNDPAAATANVHSEDDSLYSIRRADDAMLAHLGYKSEFRREFSVCCVVLLYAVTLTYFDRDGPLAFRDDRVCVLYHGCCSFGFVNVLVWTLLGYGGHAIKTMDS